MCGGPRSDFTVNATDKFLFNANSCTNETGDFTSELSISEPSPVMLYKNVHYSIAYFISTYNQY